MYFSIGEHVVETQKWETQDQMLEHLKNCNSGFVLLNRDPEYKADFYSAIVHFNYSVVNEISFQASEEIQLGMGLYSEIIGLPPHLLWLPPKEIVIGFDNKVVGIRIDREELSFQIDLDTPFHSFLLLDNLDVLLVFSEIGIIALRKDGSEIWRYEKDILSDSIIKSNIITLLFLDSPSVKINLITGEFC